MFNARTLPSLLSSQTIINTVADDADRNDNNRIDSFPDEYLELREESTDLANLFAQSPSNAALAVTVFYQVAQRVASVAIDFDERRKFGVGKRRTVAVLTANPNPQELGNDTLVTIPSAQGLGSIRPHTTRRVIFIGNRGQQQARNHASVADAGVASVVARWIIQAEEMRGDLK